MDRACEILMGDKFANLEQVAEILQAEITPIVKNFLLLSKDVVVRYKKTENKFVFSVEIEANRVKPFGIKL